MSRSSQGLEQELLYCILAPWFRGVETASVKEVAPGQTRLLWDAGREHERWAAS